jgi:hypothetical protein
MQAARHRSSSARSGGALAEATLDALAADLTVPHARPLVDLERDEYADVEVEPDDPATTEFTRIDITVDDDPPPTRRSRARTQRIRPDTSARIVAALATVALGFGLGAVVASLIV